MGYASYGIHVIEYNTDVVELVMYDTAYIFVYDNIVGLCNWKFKVIFTLSSKVM